MAGKGAGPCYRFAYYQISCACSTWCGQRNIPVFPRPRWNRWAYENPFYLRLKVKDRPGVLAASLPFFPRRKFHCFSTAGCGGRWNKAAELVIVTHKAVRKSLLSALEDIKSFRYCRQMRIFAIETEWYIIKGLNTEARRTQRQEKLSWRHDCCRRNRPGRFGTFHPRSYRQSINR